jgi:hypothetical protein
MEERSGSDTGCSELTALRMLAAETADWKSEMGSGWISGSEWAV